MIDNIKKKALENHIPIIMDDTLEVVSKILEKVRPKNILEIGTAVGYSAICFSEYLADSGCIDTIERDEQRAKEAIENFSEYVNIISSKTGVTNVKPNANHTVERTQAVYPIDLNVCFHHLIQQ